MMSKYQILRKRFQSKFLCLKESKHLFICRYCNQIIHASWLFIHFRLGRELQTLETENNVIVCWTSGDDPYQEALQAQFISKCHQFLEKIKPESLFLLKLKEKYSGMVFNAYEECLRIVSMLLA